MLDSMYSDVISVRVSVRVRVLVVRLMYLIPCKTIVHMIGTVVRCSDSKHHFEAK